MPACARRFHQRHGRARAVVRGDAEDMVVGLAPRPRRASACERLQPARRHVGEADLENVLAGDRGLQLQRRIQRHEFAVVDDGDAVAELVGLVHVMGGDQDGQVALALEAREHLPHGDARDRVEAGGRLVEKEDLRLVHQAARDFQPAPHAAGEHLHRLVRPLRQVDGREQLADGCAGVARAECRRAWRRCSCSPRRSGRGRRSSPAG